MKFKSTQRDALCKAAALRRLPGLLTHPLVPVGKCWTDQPLAGRAMDRVASFGYFSLREKSDSRAGRREKRLTSLAKA